MKVLIIGSKGFIGSNLYRYLSAQKYEVYGADVITDYTDSKYTCLDISNSDFHNLFENTNYDVCINCSGAANVPESINNPLRDFNLNTVNVFKALDAIKKYQPNCKFITLSSAAVYGNPSKLPISENHSVDPVSPYGLHKMYSEQICKEFTESFGIKTCSLRIFSSYGEPLRKQLFWDLFKKAEAGSPIKLYGTGNESRDFIYIADLVKAIEIAMVNSNYNADIINVANGVEVFIKEAVSVFYSMFPQKINYEFSGESRKGDPINWKADVSILKNMGYKPMFCIEKGLKNYYNWLKS